VYLSVSSATAVVLRQVCHDVVAATAAVLLAEDIGTLARLITIPKDCAGYAQPVREVIELAASYLHLLPNHEPQGSDPSCRRRPANPCPAGISEVVFVTSSPHALGASISPARWEYVLRAGHECVSWLVIDFSPAGHADVNCNVPVGTGHRIACSLGCQGWRCRAMSSPASLGRAGLIGSYIHTYATAEAAIIGAAAV